MAVSKLPVNYFRWDWRSCPKAMAGSSYPGQLSRMVSIRSILKIHQFGES